MKKNVFYIIPVKSKKVFERSRKTFFKKFSERVAGQRPAKKPCGAEPCEKDS